MRCAYSLTASSFLICCNISVLLPAGDSSRITRDGNWTRSLRIQAFPRPRPSRYMTFCSKCSIAGMLTTSRGICRCIGSHPNCWSWSMRSSLMAGSNFMTRYLGDESARLRFIREAVQRRASVTQMLRRSSTWESRRRWLLDWARFTNGIWSTGISSQQTSW